MTYFFHKPFLLCLVFTLALSSCAVPQTAVEQTDQSEETEPENISMRVQSGIVRHIRDVKVSSARTVGTIGGEKEGIFSGFWGSLAGSAYSAKSQRETEALEITILLDNGQEIVVVQDTDDFFKKGDRVRLLTGRDGSARVQNE